MYNLFYNQTQPVSMLPAQPLPMLPTQGMTRSEPVPFIDSSCIERQTKIGEGSFGEVYRGTLNNVTAVAIKMLKETDIDNERRFLNEAKTMKMMDHPNVVKFYGVTKLSNKTCIVSEFMDMGSLESMIQRNNGTLTVVDLTTIAEQIVLGMCHISELNIVHRDLRTANVLVNSRSQIKVADFGLAKRGVSCPQVTGTGMYTKVIGYVTYSPFPYFWTAPEARDYKMFTSLSDVYSFGCLMFEMITNGRTPFKDMTNNVDLVIDPAYLNHPYYVLMKSCLSFVAGQRPSFAMLKESFANLLRPLQPEAVSIASGQFSPLPASGSTVPILFTTPAGVPGISYAVPQYTGYFANTYQQPVFYQSITEQRCQSVPLYMF